MSCDLEVKGPMDLGLAIHTAPKAVSTHNKVPFSREARFSTPWLVYSQKGGKEKNTAHTAGAIINQVTLSPVLLDTEPSQQKNAANGLQDQQGNMDQSPTQQRLNIQNQAENHDHHAKSVWNMVTELGLTTGTSKRNYVQMLEDMEERDGEEAASLGIKRWTP